MVEEKVDSIITINQPAGHLENNESLFDAVIRETLEETRWQFEPKYISGIYQWQHDNGETFLRVSFVGDVSNENTSLDLDPDIEQAIWLTQEEIEQHANARSPLVIKSIQDYVDGCSYPISLIQNIK